MSIDLVFDSHRLDGGKVLFFKSFRNFTAGEGK